MSNHLLDKISTPDMNVFIWSCMPGKFGKWSREYFNKLERGELSLTILFSHTSIQLNSWMLKISTTINSFFNYCNQKKLKPDIYLKRIEEERKNNFENRVFRYINIIREIINKKLVIDKFLTSLKTIIDEEMKLFFQRDVHFKFVNQTIVKNYEDAISSQIKNKSKLNDWEDIKFLCEINFYIFEENISKIHLVTYDIKHLIKNRNDLINWNNRIMIQTPEEFLKDT